MSDHKNFNKVYAKEGFGWAKADQAMGCNKIYNNNAQFIPYSQQLVQVSNSSGIPVKPYAYMPPRGGRQPDLMKRYQGVGGYIDSPLL
jgi:hypothetical protein